MIRYLIFTIPLFIGCTTVNFKMMNYTAGVVRPINKSDFFEIVKSGTDKSSLIKKAQDNNGLIRDEIFNKLKSLGQVTDTSLVKTDIRMVVVFKRFNDTIFCHLNGIIEYQDKFYYDNCFSMSVGNLFLDSTVAGNKIGFYSDKYCDDKW